MTSWVVGARGLLGSGVTRALTQRGNAVVDVSPIPWGSAEASGALANGLRSLVDSSAGEPWTVYWCAGAGVTDTSAETLATEFETFEAFLAAVADLPAADRARGVIAFASSAGGVYGGSARPPFTEATAPAPLGAYGEAKLRAERALETLAKGSGVSVLVARIANLYGPGQDLTKQQGLISRLCLSAVTRTPVSVFVSLDTRRDYLYVTDGAALLIACADRAHEQPSGTFTAKILGSGRSTTIASLIGQFGKIGGSVPRVVTGSSRSAALQARDLRLTSEVWPDLDAVPSTTLAEGVGRTMADLRERWLQPGRLAGGSAAPKI